MKIPSSSLSFRFAVQGYLLLLVARCVPAHNHHHHHLRESQHDHSHDHDHNRHHHDHNHVELHRFLAQDVNLIVGSTTTTTTTSQSLTKGVTVRLPKGHFRDILANAIPKDDDNVADPHEYCGTASPDKLDAVMEQARLQVAAQRASSHNHHHHHHVRRLQEMTANCDEIVAACQQCIEVPVNVGLIGLTLQASNGQLVDFLPHPTSAMQRLIDGNTVPVEDFSTIVDIQQLVKRNIDVLNEAFVKTPFKFVWNAITNTKVAFDDNYSVVANIAAFPQEIANKVGVDDSRTLNIYVGWGVLQTDRGVVLGLASPAAAQRFGVGDGIYIRYDVLTDGGFTRQEGGYTVVHEVGHWLGLWHTFQKWVASDENSCDPRELEWNDFIDDTPVMAGASTAVNSDSCVAYYDGRRPLPDTCPGLPGKDPIWNFMNYLDRDECWAQEGQFTCNQVERMYREWLLFRDPVEICDNPQTHGELEIIFTVDGQYLTDQFEIELKNKDGDILFRSITDHYFSYFIFPDVDLMEVDLCLPRGQVYTLTVENVRGGDGFSDNGRLEISVDKKLVDSIQGNFGAKVEKRIRISASGMSNPTDAPTMSPTGKPTKSPTSEPKTSTPTSSPSPFPFNLPTFSPTNGPTSLPTTHPTSKPTITPPVASSTAPPTTPTSTYAPTQNTVTKQPAPKWEACRNDKEWFIQTGGRTRNCRWVGKKPLERCNVKGADGRKAFLACPRACRNDDTWLAGVERKNGKPADCSWVKNKPGQRCGVVGAADGMPRAFKACAMACCRYNYKRWFRNNNNPAAEKNQQGNTTDVYDGGEDEEDYYGGQDYYYHDEEEEEYYYGDEDYQDPGDNEVGSANNIFDWKS